MSMIAVCDGCGKTAPAGHNDQHWYKPASWFERTTNDGREILTACSRECIKKINDKRKEEGKETHSVVLPI